MIYILKEDVEFRPNHPTLIEQVWAVTKEKYEKIGFNGAVTHIKQDLQNKGIPLNVIDDYFKNISKPQARNTYEYLFYVKIAY